MLRDEELQEIVAFFNKCIISQRANRYLNRLIAAFRAARAENEGLQDIVKIMAEWIWGTDMDVYDTATNTVEGIIEYFTKQREARGEKHNVNAK